MADQREVVMEPIRETVDEELVSFLLSIHDHINVPNRHVETRL